MDELNDYVFLSKEEINKLIAVWDSNKLVKENIEFTCMSAARKFTLTVVGTNRDPDNSILNPSGSCISISWLRL